MSTEHPRLPTSPTSARPQLADNESYVVFTSVPLSAPEEEVLDVHNSETHHKVDLNQQTGFWYEYNTQADAHDSVLIKSLALDLDTLLIFVSKLV